MNDPNERLTNDSEWVVKDAQCERNFFCINVMYQGHFHIIRSLDRFGAKISILFVKTVFEC